ncbi:MAG: ATP cone domain-containing protein, partial [Opitutaceae bacterium]|nr:ATP cone domain-containing protein [Opitutaceae bacterium]
MNPVLQQDLALKKATHTPRDQKPAYAWRDCIPADTALLPEITLLAPLGETRFDLGEIADSLGQALVNVHLARGEQGNVFTADSKAFVGRIVKEVAAHLATEAQRTSPLRLSLNDLYHLLERVLVEAKAYDVAKSLLLNRGRKIATGAGTATSVRVIRRNKQVVPYIPQKVEVAVRKALLSLQLDSRPAVAITEAVTTRVLSSKQAFIHIEEVQDMVQEELMKSGHFKVAEAYILYRAARNEARAHDSSAASEAQVSGLSPQPSDSSSQPTMIVV